MKTSLFNSASCALLFAALVSPLSLAAAKFEILPASGDSLGMGRVGALSKDGSALVASTWALSTWSPQAFQWTSTAGSRFLSLSGAVSGAATGLSGDGKVVSGYRFAPKRTAAGWSNGTLIKLTGFNNSRANDVNRAGTIFVGANPLREGSTFLPVAARWSAAGALTSLGDLVGGATESEATRISADGTTIVGWGTSAKGIEAFRYASGKMVSLGELAGGTWFSEALAVSANGAVIVGRSESARGGEAFVWTQAKGLVALGDLPGGAFQSQATAVSGDGLLVAGTAVSAADAEVFVWDAYYGMRSLRGLCRAGGIDLQGYRFSYTRPVLSEDGDTIAGDAVAANQSPVLWRLTGLRSLLAGIPQTTVVTILSGASATLRFQTEAGFSYQVQRSNTAANPLWVSQGSPIPGDGIEHILVLEGQPAGAVYRILVASLK